MPMNRAKKAEEFEEIKACLEGGTLVVVVRNDGMTVKEVSALRSKLRAEGGRYKVTKNTLARRALAGSKFEKISGLFKGPVGIAVSQDPVAAARIAQDFVKGCPKLVIVGGALGEMVLDAEGVKALASLPSLDALRGKLVGLLQAPATKLAGILQAPARDLVGVTRAYGEKAA